jgi:hypothetical protein
MTYPQGPRCRSCHSTEADCAYRGGCCTPQACSHFTHLDGRGNDRDHQNGRPRSSAPCGTDAGYHAHRTRRELSCVPCKAAHARHVAAQKAAS